MSRFQCLNGYGDVRWCEVGDLQNNCRDGSDETNVKEVMRQIQNILNKCGISLEACGIVQRKYIWPCNSETINIKDTDKIEEILKIVQEDNENLAHLSKMLEKKIAPNNLSTFTNLVLGLGVTVLLAYKFAPKMYQWWKKSKTWIMEKW